MLITNKHIQAFQKQHILFIFVIIDMALVTLITPAPWAEIQIKLWQWHILSSGYPSCKEFLTHDNSVIIIIISADNLCQ